MVDQKAGEAAVRAGNVYGLRMEDRLDRDAGDEADNLGPGGLGIRVITYLPVGLARSHRSGQAQLQTVQRTAIGGIRSAAANNLQSMRGQVEGSLDQALRRAARDAEVAISPV